MTPRRRILAACVLGCAAAVGVGVVAGPAMGCVAACIEGACVAISLLCRPTNDKEAPPSTPDVRLAQTADSSRDVNQQSEAHASPAAGDEPAPKAEPQPMAEHAPEATPMDVPDSDQEPTATDASTAAASFSFDEFCEELLSSERPLEFLCDFCERCADNKQATPFERYLTRRLSEADIASWKYEDAPRLDLIVPLHSGSFYLRETPHIEYGHHLKVLRIEAALNAARFAASYYDDPSSVSEEELMRLERRHISSVCAQVPDISSSDWSYLAMPWQTNWGPSDRGEWAVRSSLSEAIETLQVPYRLVASFRSNVAGGDVAIEVTSTPPRAFPRTAFVAEMGIVPTTAHMRGRESSHYDARMGILLANCAFRASDRVRRVWVACVRNAPSTRTCLYWACIDRRSLSRLRMDAIGNPLDALRGLGATFQAEAEVLQPIEQGFYLEDERFCPSKRHDLWQMSERTLPPSAALHLGTSRVSGLVIHEELLRSIVADDALRGMVAANAPDATQAGVRSVLEAAGKTSDIDVWSAAERVARKLVDGSLDLDNAEAVREELVSGDELSRAVMRAQSSLFQEEPEKALEQLLQALRPIDGNAMYDDTPSTVYRSFDSFVERALYNRLNARDHRLVVLVPDAYVIAHLMVSGILLARTLSKDAAHDTDATEALAHAQRALEVAPLSTSSHLGLVACLERTNLLDEAEAALKAMLELAHDPQGVAFGYYRMASIQWQLDHHHACLACYQLAAGISPMLIPMVIAECHILAQTDPLLGSPMEAHEVSEALKERDIPLAPTPRVSFLLYDCATASIDAEVFPVARDLMRVLESFTGDDIIHGIRNSLEREPDV